LDDEEEDYRLTPVSSVKTLPNTPLYALPTDHKGMQKVRQRREKREEFKKTIKKSILDTRTETQLHK
jgi:hypothetical protein